MRTSDEQKSLAKLMAGQGQPGNVTGGSAGIPGILGLLNQQSSGTGANSYKPFRTIDDFINGVRNPAIPGVSSNEALQAQAARESMRQAPQVPTTVNPVSQIMAQLQKLLSGENNMPQFSAISLPKFDPNQYKNQAEATVSEQFNPILQQIKAQQAQTQQRAGSNRQALAQLYAGMNNELKAEAAQTTKEYDAAQASANNLYTDERNRIAAGYAADAAAQRAQQKKLGTEALGDNGATAQQNADKQFADQMGSQQMQSENAYFDKAGLAAADYDRSIAQATRQEGVNSQQDIMNQLEDYMSQSNTNYANTQAQEAGSITDLMMKMAQAGYDRDAQNAQFQYQQQRDYIGDSQNMAKQQADLLLAQLQAAQDAQKSSSGQLNPWQQVATFADQLQPGHGQDIVGAIQAAMNERGEIYARSKDDTPMNPALFAKLVADYPGNSGLDRNSLMMVAQELYRQLYGT